MSKNLDDEISYVEGNLLDGGFSEDPERDVDLALGWIDRDVLETGITGAEATARQIARMHPKYSGKVSLSFTGWGEDDRAIWEIPAIRDFCRYLLFSAPKTIVRTLWSRPGQSDEFELVGAVGLHLLIFCAFPDDIKSSTTPSGSQKWSGGTSELIRRWLIEETVAPENIFAKYKRDFHKLRKHMTPN